jgi:hexokinase
VTARAATVVVAWLAGILLGVGAATEELRLILMGGMLSIWVVFYFRSFAAKEPAE